MGPQVGHQVAAQGLHVQNVVLHRAGVGQVQAHALVLKLGPEDAGGVQQFQVLVDGHPLLGPGNAGAVLGLGGFPACHLIDKGGLAHVGDAQDHYPDHPARLSFFRIGPELVREQLPHSGGKPGGALSPLGIGLQHSISLGPEIGGPAVGGGAVRLVRPVQNHQPGLPRRQFVHVRIPAGDGDPGI